MYVVNAYSVFISVNKRAEYKGLPVKPFSIVWKISNTLSGNPFLILSD
ncbi:hypothetical protein QSI_3783 [Clostridioides difficile P28]|nr:hypothetical protein QSI_3783 [Clostridioides difficile P28]